MPQIFETLLNKEIKIPLSWIFALLLGVGSLGIGYGGYKAAVAQNANDVNLAKQQIIALQKDISDLRFDLGQLKQSVDDLKDSLDRHDRH